MSIATETKVKALEEKVAALEVRLLELELLLRPTRDDAPSRPTIRLNGKKN